MNQPIKLLLVCAMVAVLGASFASHSLGDRGVTAVATAAPAQTAGNGLQPAQRSRSWFSGWFDGMEFNRTAAPPPAITQAARSPAPSAPASQPARGFGDVRLQADRGGQYHANVEIDGQTVPMLVDTGATVVALRQEDAQRLGISVMPSDFTNPVSTANGQISGARVRLREMRVENIVVHDVTALVLPQGALQKSLLGMSFLRKLAKFEVSGDNLILRP